MVAGSAIEAFLYKSDSAKFVILFDEFLQVSSCLLLSTDLLIQGGLDVFIPGYPEQLRSIPQSRQAPSLPSSLLIG